MNILRSLKLRLKILLMVQRIQKIRLLILDFDGVLTDNTVYVSEDGKETVRCSRSDGLGIKAIEKAGYKVIVLSTEKNCVVGKRCEKLGLEFHQGVSNKKEYTENFILHEYNLCHENILYIGNDLNDLPMMSTGCLTACPSDSHKKVMKICDINLTKKGGEGLTMHVASLILGINVGRVLGYE